MESTSLTTVTAAPYGCTDAPPGMSISSVVGDGHTLKPDLYRDPSTCGVGVRLRSDQSGYFVIEEVFVGGTAASSGCVHIGDRLTAVDGCRSLLRRR